ncbi:Crp/Fnr family transcriptional regulator [bacterium SCSIO 12741]|nr:Crp/Fnr family transcriptional regulator [bacterium SCSIO 12741]
MEESPIRQFFLQSGLSEEAVALMTEHWNIPKTLKRGEFLSRPDQIEHFLYYIHHGTMRIYLTRDDSEYDVGFGYDNTLINSFPSFVTQEPDGYHIQILKTAKLTAIRRQDFYDAMGQSREIAEFWTRSMELAVLGKTDRETDLLILSPQERAQKLLKRSPQVFQFIPRKYLASYLRMSPETLSRLKL